MHQPVVVAFCLVTLGPSVPFCFYLDNAIIIGRQIVIYEATELKEYIYIYSYYYYVSLGIVQCYTH